MILSAHQPAYLPWLGYFHKIAVSDKFVILDDVQFEKNSFTNRNKIKTSNGSAWLSVPIQLNGHISKTIKDMSINNTINWKEKHWKSIYLNYKKSPYFHSYCDFFEDTYKKEWIKLDDLTNYITNYILKELGIKTKMYKQSEIKTNNKKQELILELCEKTNSDIFVFGKLGKSYVDIDVFKTHGVNSYFQDYKHPVYEQIWGEFIPNLAVIDLLFNVSRDNALQIIMNENVTQNEIRKIFLR